MALPSRVGSAAKSSESSMIWNAMPIRSPYVASASTASASSPPARPPIRQQADMNVAVFWRMMRR